MSNQLLSEAFSDFQRDFEELEYLVSSNIDQLKKIKKRIISVKSSLYPDSYKNINIDVDHFSDIYHKMFRRIHQNKALTTRSPTISGYESLIKEKNSLYDILRTQQGIFASVIVSSDWQSPSFLHSIYSQAGAQTGKITGNITDYKRDSHLDAAEYEKQFVKEFIESRFKFNIFAYATNSGMAAFTTILGFLMGEKKLNGKVLVGKNSYFQYKILLQNILEGNLIEIDESNTKSILHAIERYQPSAIFLDTICNSPHIAVPELPTIQKYLYTHAKDDTYLVIDNTCASIGYQLLNLRQSRKIHLILWESLNKYYQFGLDRVTGGIIVARGKDVGKLYFYREDMGTIFSDASVYALPIPDRKYLTTRLERFQRNGQLIYSFLNDLIFNSTNKYIEHIYYPKDCTHLSYTGSFLTIQFKKKFQSIRLYKNFVRNMIFEAQKEKVDLSAGTSFGLNKTRVYHAVPHDRSFDPFIRIAVGTEDRYQVEKFKEVFKKML